MATIDVSGVPAKVTITNVSSRVKNVQLYKTNTTVVMQPGDILVLKVDFSSELTYFLSLKSTELTVSNEAITEGE